jgi:Cu(I)/Ag(I) efflux system protein CusF
MPVPYNPLHLKLARHAVLALLVAAAPGLVHAQSMNMPGMEKKEPSKAAAKSATGTGTVTALNAAGRKVTLDHAPMPELNWPAMKMEFTATGAADLSKVKTGDKVRFTVMSAGNAYIIQSISPAP